MLVNSSPSSSPSPSPSGRNRFLMSWWEDQTDGVPNWCWLDLCATASSTHLILFWFYLSTHFYGTVMQLIFNRLVASRLPKIASKYGNSITNAPWEAALTRGRSRGGGQGLGPRPCRKRPHFLGQNNDILWKKILILVVKSATFGPKKQKWGPKYQYAQLKDWIRSHMGATGANVPPFFEFGHPPWKILDPPLALTA